MALTAQQLVDLRFFMGYSVTGNTTSAPFRELVYSDVSYFGLSIDYRLANLSQEEENVVTSYFLPNLYSRRNEIQSAAENLDTDKAAIWTRNRAEVSDRTALYNALRRELCSFLGFEPGPMITASNRVMRG
jgi:hypothetical protein